METILLIAAIVGLYKLWRVDWQGSSRQRVQLTPEEREWQRRDAVVEVERRRRADVAEAARAQAEKDRKFYEGLERARNCWKCGGKGYFPVGNVGMAGCSHNW